jgi:hypothetical protein
MARSYEKIDFDGIKFDSKSELEYYKKLKDMRSRGKIKDFKCNPHYILQEGDWINWRDEKQDSIDHYPDYLVTLLDGSQIIIDTKGGSVLTHEFSASLKKLLFEYQNRNIPYYFISKLPRYLGEHWVESSPRHDFYGKLTKMYKKLFPKENTRQWQTCKRFLPKEWVDYFDVVDLQGLFYYYNKQYTKKDLEKMAKDKLKK